MNKYFTLIAILLFNAGIQAQVPSNGPRRTALPNELRLTQYHKFQLQQLFHEERVQQYLRKKRLEQMLTPDQIKKLKQSKRQENSPDDDSLQVKKNPK